MDKETKIYNSMVAGMFGDAYGYPVEFSDYDLIKQTYTKPRKWFNQQKPQNPLNKYCIEASDDSQMSLFTLKAVLEYKNQTNIDVFSKNYQNWFYTQTHNFRTQDHHEDALLKESLLYKRQAPGMTCLRSLNVISDTQINPTPQSPLNNSKGCGGIMRTLPLNLLNLTKDQLWDLSCEVSALTHGHPDGYLSSASFNILVYYLLSTFRTFEESFYQAFCFIEYKLEQETQNKTLEYVKTIKQLINDKKSKPLVGSQLTQLLDEGWTGESSFAIAGYCVLKAKNWEELMMLSAWHSGDSDSTCSLACQLMAFKEPLPNFILKNKDKIDLIPLIDRTLNC